MKHSKKRKNKPIDDTNLEMATSTGMKEEKRTASPTSSSNTSVPNEEHPCSYQHSSKCSNTMPAYISFLPTLGDFNKFPLEIFEIILEYLSVKDISMMSMVSKIIRDRIVNYISTPSGNRRFFPQDFHNENQSDSAESSILEHYSSLGLLFKRCTLLLPTKERLKYINRMFSEISCFQFYGCFDPLHCLGLHCYGVFLQTLTAGWDEDECQRVYNFLCDVTNLPRRIQRIVSSKPGRFRKLELRIRSFCRDVLLNHWIHQSDSVFWLTCILKPWPMVNQARLLYLIFGPASVHDGNVNWRNMIQGPTEENNLKELADTVKLLYETEKDEWMAIDVVGLVDELAVIPEEWHLENSARFLIMCGNNICFPFMASKAVDGQAIELARLVVFQTLVCEKDLYCMGWTVKMMQKVCNVFTTENEKNIFLQSIENTFAQIIMDSLQLVISGEHDEEETSFLNLFHLVNAQANFHKEILYLTMNYNMQIIFKSLLREYLKAHHRIAGKTNDCLCLSEVTKEDHITIININQLPSIQSDHENAIMAGNKKTLDLAHPGSTQDAFPRTSLFVPSIRFECQRTRNTIMLSTTTELFKEY